MSYAFKTISILCQIKTDRGRGWGGVGGTKTVHLSIKLGFNGSPQTRIEDKTTSTIKSVQTQSTFIWQIVKAVAYR